MFLALVTFSLNKALGSPESAQATITNVLSHQEVATGVADSLIEQLLKDASPETVAQIDAQRAQLAQAASQAVMDSKDVLGQAAGAAYQAFLTNQSTTINVHDALNSVVAAMHTVNPDIPAQLDSADAGVFTITADSSADHLQKVDAITKVKQLLNMWWLFLVIAVGLFYAISVLDKRKKFGAWRWPGFIMTISGGIVVLAGFVIPGAATGNLDVDKQATAKSAAQALTSGLIGVAFAILIAGVALVVASYVVKEKS